MRQKSFIAVVAVLVGVILALGWRFTHPSAPPSLRESLPITRYTLSNGLRVIIIENHRTPAVSHMMFIRAGSGDEPMGKSGIAHYAEHMMFKGTKTVPGEEYDRRIAALGGTGNAYTTADYTAYYVNAPKDALDTVMALESDRFLNLRASDQDAATELKVILEERRQRIESSPTAILSEQLDALQFLTHPYRIPVIGWEHEIQALTPSDVRQFLATHYVPSNMVLVVAGDVEPREVRRLAMRNYGALKVQTTPERQWLSEPPMRTERQAIYRDSRVKERKFVRQYSAPSMGNAPAEQSVALGLAAQWLGGGRTGVLYQRLVDEQQLAVDVSMYYVDGVFGPGTVSISATPREGVSMRALSRAIDAAVSDALSRAPTEDEVARAKTLMRADIVYAQDGLMPMASYLGMLSMIGKDEQFFYDLPARIQQVRAEDMQAIAARVLVPNASVTGWLLPPKKAGM